MSSAEIPGPEEVRAALEQLYRDPGDAGGPRVTGCAKLAEGWESDIYAFSVEEPAAEGEASSLWELCAKIYLGRKAEKKCRKELGVMRYLGETEVPVPEVLRQELKDSPLGRPLLVMARIDGEHIGKVFSNLPETEQPRLIELFCRLFVDLHALDWVPLARTFGISEEDGSAFLEDELKQLRKQIKKFDKHEFVPVWKWLRDRARGVTSERLSILHGDFHQSNVLMLADGTPSIIDWGGASFGDFRKDLAWTLLLLSSEGGPEVREIVLAEYQRQAEATVEDLDFFDALAACKRLLGMSVSLSHGAEHLGMRPGLAVSLEGERLEQMAFVHGELVRLTGLEVPEFAERFAGRGGSAHS